MIGSSGKKFYYHNDHLGSALAVTDENGNKVVERDFTPFGERINTDIYDDESRDLEEDESGFTGKDWDVDAELYYYNARWYDPGIGRFISEDSVADDPNLYGYCGANPVNFTDPTGHFSINWAGGLMGLASTYIPGFGELMSITSLSSKLFVGDGAKTKDGTQTPKPTAGPAKEGVTRTGDKPASTPNPNGNNTQVSTQPSNQKITLSSMAEKIQEENKNATVKVLDDNKLLITTNTGINDKIKIDFLGIELNGDIIVIEQIQYYDEKGVGCTNLYRVH